ncbi:cytochrome c peroxidase [soil metagenome]
MWWRASLALAAVLITGSASTTPEWSAEEIKVLRSLWIGALPSAPANPSNRLADDPAAAALGRSLFSDTRLSANNQVSCATCHYPWRGFTDAVPTGRGVGIGIRRTMPIAQAVYSPWQFWDGRADSLWSQALGPVENPLEHGSTRTQVARVLATHYRGPYELVFGPLPNLSDLRRFPARASPMSDGPAKRAWAGMALADRKTVDRIFANFGKSIEAFERTLKVAPTRFDGYVAGVVRAPGPRVSLTSSEVAGLRLFIGKAHCTTCHSGPMLSNEGFANTGVPARPGLPLDTGRIAGARIAHAEPFNCKGAFSDAQGPACAELEFMVVDDPSQVRAFKVPSLRGVGQRAPYMHAGQYASLAQVIDHYNRAPKAPSGTSELKPLHLSARERRDLLAFLMTL